VRRPRARDLFVWGLGYRATSGRITAVGTSAFTPPSRTEDVYSGFVEYEAALMPDRLRATMGSKIEHNDYTGVEVQPSGRLAWTLAPDRTIWWAVTRAVRTPSRVETDYTTTSLLNPALPLYVRLQPNPAFVSEELVAYETGLRFRPVEAAHVTFSGFFNAHDHVLSTEVLPLFAEPPDSPSRVIVPVTFRNGLKGSSHGAEITADVRPRPWWRWTANYSYLRIQLSKRPGSLDGSQERRNENLSPRHQVQVQSALDFGGRWSLNAFVRHVSELPEGPVPAYWTTNLRLAYEIAPGFELAVTGQDLNEPHHLEWASGANIQIRRSAYVSLGWRR
jgi:iron complex outermembrane receptor protein